MPTKPPFDQLFGTLYCVVIHRDVKLDGHIGIALSLARASKRAEYYSTCCRDSACEAVVRRMSVEVHYQFAPRSAACYQRQGSS